MRFVPVMGRIHGAFCLAPAIGRRGVREQAVLAALRMPGEERAVFRPGGGVGCPGAGISPFGPSLIFPFGRCRLRARYEKRRFFVLRKTARKRKGTTKPVGEESGRVEGVMAKV